MDWCVIYWVVALLKGLLLVVLECLIDKLFHKVAVIVVTQHLKDGFFADSIEPGVGLRV